ncbi:hypothetical protein GJT99_00710 [Enterobacteriaceae endosymbiont of Donacia cincticornis]|uniref:hypothetical protein n=1 Tax=Enterobacteriaceae endosymbiont of Donacia cincticornis TaxID=2675773 RepID=UPI001449D5E9|nr:hypothetical protein [Enterobacteriaceae endosymbiont of Donacia cincticornis]QJC36039.1 hypothetical protein GJT99_00710 [Enterobacteriaceae endosymbiont of Donacia cincticornis]
MRNNKLLLINKLFQQKYYSSYTKILYKIYIHTNILIKIDKIIKKYLPIQLHNWYNIKNIKNNILIIETNNASSMIRFLSEKSNILFYIKKYAIPSLRRIDIKINPIFTKNIFKKKKKIKKNKLSKFSANLLLHVTKKSSIKLRLTIERFIKIANN